MQNCQHFVKKKSIRLVIWRIEKRIARHLELPMHNPNTICYTWDFRVCENVELSAFSGKQIHTACILDIRRAYRSTPGAPDARFAYYLQHFCGSGNQPQKNQKKCNTFRNLDFWVCESKELSAFSEKKSVRLAFWTHDERIARLLELPIIDLHTIYSILANLGTGPKKPKKV